MSTMSMSVFYPTLLQGMFCNVLHVLPLSLVYGVWSFQAGWIGKSMWPLSLGCLAVPPPSSLQQHRVLLAACALLSSAVLWLSRWQNHWHGDLLKWCFIEICCDIIYKDKFLVKWPILVALLAEPLLWLHFPYSFTLTVQKRRKSLIRWYIPTFNFYFQQLKQKPFFLNLWLPYFGIRRACCWLISWKGQQQSMHLYDVTFMRCHWTSLSWGTDKHCVASPG